MAKKAAEKVVKTSILTPGRFRVARTSFHGPIEEIVTVEGETTRVIITQGTIAEPFVGRNLFEGGRNIDQIVINAAAGVDLSAKADPRAERGLDIGSMKTFARGTFMQDQTADDEGHVLGSRTVMNGRATLEARNVSGIGGMKMGGPGIGIQVKLGHEQTDE